MLGLSHPLAESQIFSTKAERSDSGRHKAYPPHFQMTVINARYRLLATKRRFLTIRCLVRCLPSPRLLARLMPQELSAAHMLSGT